jgi:hypothetical protein
MKFPIGAMNVGDVLDRGIKLLLARLPAFYLINLIVLSPLLIVMVFVFPTMLSSDSPEQAAFAALGSFGVSGLLTLLLQPIGTAAILYIITQEYVDRRVTIGQALSFALSRFGALLLTSILRGLIVFLGLFLCLVGSIYFGLIYTFVPQVVVLEGLSGTEALSRSKNLISGYIGRTFGILFLIGLGGFFLTQILILPLNQLLPFQTMVPAAGGMRMEFNTTNFMINQGVTQLLNILIQSYTAVCATLLYLDLRIRKEGLDLELAAQQQGDEGAPPAEELPR